MVVYCEGDTEAMEKMAQNIAFNILYPAYPGHPWWVRVGKGFIFIKHMDFPGSWGMMLKTSELDHDAAVLKRKIIMGAGEWLERASLKRGRYEDGQETTTVEGVKRRESTQDVKLVMPDSVTPLRDEAHRE